MVSPTNYNLNTAAFNQNSPSQKERLSSTEAEKGDQASSFKALEDLPRPPQEPIDMAAIVGKYLEEPKSVFLRTPVSSTSSEISAENDSQHLSAALSTNIEQNDLQMQNPYGHETLNSRPVTPLSTSSEDLSDEVVFKN
ncbi:MAG: hypothetical protein LBC45_00850 [Chlamydiales bacterium]|jgi:hypothetical protein|nr:hypothetical protein [Chlamydiales bacterium]